MASAPVERLLARLKRVRKSGKGWAAFCPAHDDRSPSLSIAEGDDGRALVHCFAGCRGEEIARAVGLEVRDLFPDRDGDGQRSPPRRRDTCRPVSFPMSVAEVLVETGEFTTRVAVAEALASLEPRLARQDVLDNWDWLADRVDIPEAIAWHGHFGDAPPIATCEPKTSTTQERSVDSRRRASRMPEKFTEGTWCDGRWKGASRS
jgi:hypothetical protein